MKRQDIVPIWCKARNLMNVQFIACFFATATGILFSASIASLWAAYNDEPPHLGLLQEGGPYAPFKGLVLAFSAPTALLWNGASWMAELPVAGTLFLLSGLALSLLQGVFIITVIFGIS
jgi:hypothetical protein